MWLWIREGALSFCSLFVVLVRERNPRVYLHCIPWCSWERMCSNGSHSSYQELNLDVQQSPGAAPRNGTATLPGLEMDEWSMLECTPPHECRERGERHCVNLSLSNSCHFVVQFRCKVLRSKSLCSHSFLERIWKPVWTSKSSELKMHASADMHWKTEKIKYHIISHSFTNPSHSCVSHHYSLSLTLRVMQISE